MPEDVTVEEQVDQSRLQESQKYSSPSLGRIIAKNAAFVTFGSVALKALNFLFNVYIVRKLAPDRFGLYSTVLAFVGLFQIFAELGVSQYVMREIARDHNKAHTLFWNLISVRLILALVGLGGITLAADLIGYSPELVLAIFIYTVTFLLSAFEAPMEALLTANERLDLVAGLGVLNQIVFVMVGAAFMISGFGFVWLIIAALIAMVPQVLVAVWFIRRNHFVPLPVQIDPHQWFDLIRAGLPFGMISLALTITFSLDTVMLSRFQPENVVGWYKAAYNLEISLLFFFTGFSVSLVPSLARTYAHDKATVERWYYRTTKFIMVVSLPLAVGGMLVAYPLISFLYTNAYSTSAQVLQIIIWDVPVLMFAGFCGNMTTVVGEERNAAKIYGAAAISNVLLNLYAIPHYSLFGAAVVTVVTDLVSSVLFYFLLSRKLNLPNMSGVILRVLLATALMAGAVLLVRPLGLFVMIAAGVLVYGILVIVLRMMDASERDALVRMVFRRGSSPIAPGGGVD